MTWLAALLFIVLAVPHEQTASAQNRVRILQSDQLEGVVADEGRIRKLTGDVALQTEDFSILCDSAWHFLDLEELRAWGDIEITSQKDRIWSDQATYDLVSEVALFGGVLSCSRAARSFSARKYSTALPRRSPCSPTGSDLRMSAGCS
ncbi:MAG: OstA-like protein [Bacteroidota bacterium]